MTSMLPASSDVPNFLQAIRYGFNFVFEFQFTVEFRYAVRFKFTTVKFRGTVKFRVMFGIITCGLQLIRFKSFFTGESESSQTYTSSDHGMLVEPQRRTRKIFRLSVPRAGPNSPSDGIGH